MKRKHILLIAFVYGQILLQAQVMIDVNEQEIRAREIEQMDRERDERINEYIGEQNRRLEQQLNSIREINWEKLIGQNNTTVTKPTTSNGVRIITSSCSNKSSSSNHVSYQQAQQIKKAQRDAQHRAWLEQKRQAEAQAAERRRLEEQRRREEEERRRQIRYEKLYDSEMQRTAQHAAQQQAKIAFRATEGRDFMYNYQFKGTEQLESGYIPSTDKSTYSVAAIVSKSGSKPIALGESEHNKANSKWDEMLDETKLEDRIKDYVSSSRSFTKLYITYPQDLTQLLHDEFKIVAGYDVDAIMQKLPSERTEAENHALRDYQAYRKEMLNQMAKDINGVIDNSEEKKLIDAAILADNVYDTYRKESYHTNYKRKVFFSEDHPLRGVAEAIHLIGNQSVDETGFHAEIYYNEQNDTYMISIEGSKDKKDWVNNNLPNLLNNEVIPQYDLALDIAKAINSIPEAERAKLNIEIVGHSLGGGVASVIGLATGLETKTFNAARVPASFLEKHGINGRKANNITAYHTSTDILTIAQQAAGTPAIGKSVDIGDPSTLLEKGKAMVNGALIGTTFVSVPGDVGVGAVGGALLGEKAEGHRMSPIVRSIVSENTKKAKAEWDRLRHLQLELVKAANSPELQTQETVLIR